MPLRKQLFTKGHSLRPTHCWVKPGAGQSSKVTHGSPTGQDTTGSQEGASRWRHLPKRLKAASDTGREPRANVLLIIFGAPFQIPLPSKMPHHPRAAGPTGTCTRAGQQPPAGFRPRWFRRGQSAGCKPALRPAAPGPGRSLSAQVKAVITREITKASNPRTDSQQGSFLSKAGFARHFAETKASRRFRNNRRIPTSSLRYTEREVPIRFTLNTALTP